MKRGKYSLVNRDGKVVFTGSYEECEAREKDKIVKCDDGPTIYVAKTNDGKEYKGTIKELSKIFKCSHITLYNYTRYARRSDGLFLEKV